MSLFDILAFILGKPSKVDKPVPETAAQRSVSNSASGFSNSFERQVAAEFHRLTKSKNGTVYTNLYVPYGKETAEIDLVVVMEDRLFVVECKDYSGRIYANEDQSRQWVQYITKDKTNKFYSPVAQNATHIKALCAALGITPDRCISIVVFSDRSTLCRMPDNTAKSLVLRYSDLSNIDIKRRLSSAFTSKKHLNMLQTLDTFAHADEVVKERHKQYVQEVKDSAERPKVPSRTCPVCGHPMKVRKGKYLFWGCSMFPACKHTEPYFPKND